MSSGWFDCTEPFSNNIFTGARTFSNHIIAEIAMCVEFFHMSSGWFDCTEPSLTTSLQGKQSVQGAHALVRPPRTFSNNIITEIARFVEFFHMSSGWFDCTEPFSSNIFTGARTFSNHIIAEIVRCVEFFYMSSGWFDCTEPSLTTSLQGKQGVQGARALVLGASNLLEPSGTTSSQR